MVYNIPCKFHARYVRLSLYWSIWTDGTSVDLCEVEIYGEYTIYTVLQTDIHAFALCRTVTGNVIWYTLYRNKIIISKYPFFSNLRMSHTRTLWWELFYSLSTKLSRRSLWYRRGNVFGVYSWIQRANMWQKYVAHLTIILINIYKCKKINRNL